MTSFQTERNVWTFLIIHALRGKPSRVAGQEASGPWLSGLCSRGNKQPDSQQYHLAESGCQAQEKQQRTLVWQTWKGTGRGENLTAPRLHIPALLLVFEHLQPGHRSARAEGQAGAATLAGGSMGRRKIIRWHGRPSHAWKKGGRRAEGALEEKRPLGKGLSSRVRENHSTYKPSLCNKQLCQLPEETASRKWQCPKTQHVRKNRPAVWGSGLVRENDNWYQM